ncbi:hypothetical protein H0H92_008311, partial [Tricholoma furcatifolium]
MNFLKTLRKPFRKTNKGAPVASPGTDAAVIFDSPVPTVPTRGANVPTGLGVANAVVKVAHTVLAPWPTVQAITSVLQYFIDNHKAWLNNETTCIYLVRRLKDLDKSIYEGGSSQIHDRIRQLEHDLREMKQKAVAKQYLASSEIANALNEVVKDIGDVILDYQTALQEAIFDKITQQIAT